MNRIPLPPQVKQWMEEDRRRARIEARVRPDHTEHVTPGYDPTTILFWMSIRQLQDQKNHIFLDQLEEDLVVFALPWAIYEHHGKFYYNIRHPLSKIQLHNFHIPFSKTIGRDGVTDHWATVTLKNLESLGKLLQGQTIDAFYVEINVLCDTSTEPPKPTITLRPLGTHELYLQYLQPGREAYTISWGHRYCEGKIYLPKDKIVHSFEAGTFSTKISRSLDGKTFYIYSNPRENLRYEVIDKSNIDNSYIELNLVNP